MLHPTRTDEITQKVADRFDPDLKRLLAGGRRLSRKLSPKECQHTDSDKDDKEEHHNMRRYRKIAFAHILLKSLPLSRPMITEHKAKYFIDRRHDFRLYFEYCRSEPLIHFLNYDRDMLGVSGGFCAVLCSRRATFCC